MDGDIKPEKPVNKKAERIFPMLKAMAPGFFLAIMVTDFIPKIYNFLYMLTTDFSVQSFLGIFGLSFSLMLCALLAAVKVLCGVIAVLPGLAAILYLDHRYPHVNDSGSPRIYNAALGIGILNGLLVTFMAGLAVPTLLRMMGYFAGGAVASAYIYLRSRREAGHYNG